MKLLEETGELAQTILSSTKAPGCGYKGLTIENSQEEIVDVIIVAIAMFPLLKLNKKKFTTILEKKLDKWVEKSQIY